MKTTNVDLSFEQPIIDRPNLYFQGFERMFFRIFLKRYQTRGIKYYVAVQLPDDNFKTVFVCTYYQDKIAVKKEFCRLNDNQRQELKEHFNSLRFREKFLRDTYKEHKASGIFLSHHERFGEEIFCADLEELYIGDYVTML